MKLIITAVVICRMQIIWILEPDIRRQVLKFYLLNSLVQTEIG